VIDGDPVGPDGCLFFGWPGGSLKQWLIGIVGWTAIIVVLYFTFSWLRS